MKIEQQQIAHNIAEMLCSPLDFPRLVSQVYEDGNRIFIELGAGSNCAKWIQESLKGKPHLSMSINRKGVDDYTSILKIVARLLSHRAKLDLSRLYSGSREVKQRFG